MIYDYERRQGKVFHRLESEDQKRGKMRILREICHSVNHCKPGDDELDVISSEIGFVKNRMIDNLAGYDSETRNFDQIYQAYENYKSEHSYIDFDDMLTYAYRILKQCPEILDYYKNRYRYLQVDEGQDLTKIQFEILGQIAGRESPNLFIVADDDQSVYSFRGAEPQHILNMGKIYDSCAVYKLENNYRSTKNIVSASSQFIKKNGSRYDKSHFTRNGEASDPQILDVKDEAEQADYLLRELAQARASDPRPSVAVIYRNSLSSVGIADALERAGVDFRVRQSKMHFFNNWVVLDIAAILRFSADQTDTESFSRIYFKIKRYISKAMVEYAGSVPFKFSFLDAVLAFPNLRKYQQHNLEELKSEFERLHRMKPEEALNYIETEFKYTEFMREYCEKIRNSYDSACGVFGTLKYIAAGCESVDGMLARMERLRELFESGELKKRQAPVTLTTMHSAKGLEFDWVYMVDLTNDETPGIVVSSEAMAHDPLVEEERRLFYVGMTRAKNRLCLIRPQYRGGMPEARSVFVNELAECLHIPAAAPSGRIEEGALVHHKYFGEGVVESCHRQNDDMILEVSFRDSKRTLDYNLCMQNGLLSVE